ncbi:aspartyl/asparaginyl beta-hydroxylase domain-containing protein [Sphingomonas sp.]|uniref:aspartyl/asparaginyl beta-hydroxylase domain-containing protein n=1 Tax=Sphingomonas sp. TaxID=28214 RepID=UPI003AFF8910
MAVKAVDLVARADAAASRGDPRSARVLLQQAVDAAPGDAAIRVRLAATCRAVGDRAEALSAIESALAIDPIDLTALLMRAHLLESLQSPDAGPAYDRALEQRPPGNVPPSLVAMIAHAELRRGVYRDTAERLLRKAASSTTMSATLAERARLDRFRTNSLRATRVWHPQPTDFHYPGLRAREFHDRELFEWLATLEAATDMIAGELDAVMTAERHELVPYVRYPAHHPLRQWNALNHSLDWSAIHLLQNGEHVEANARHCPGTMALIRELPQPRIAGASPNALFSLLAPGARIPPHHGIANTRLVCHLPLIVPGNCWFRVGAERREWHRGEAWVFDDTIEHEAANESDALRVILIVDIWHPDLSAVEREGVAAMIAARAAWPAGGL